MKTDSDEMFKKCIQDFHNWRSKNLIAFRIGLALLVLWFFSPFIVKAIARLGSFSDPGNYGDTYGMINALFSGIAVLLLFFTFRTQKEELSQTMEALRQSAKSQDTLVLISSRSAKLQALPVLISQIELLLKNHYDYRDHFFDLYTTQSILESTFRNRSYMLSSGISPKSDEVTKISKEITLLNQLLYLYQEFSRISDQLDRVMIEREMEEDYSGL